MQASQAGNQAIISTCLRGALEGFGLHVGELWRREVTGKQARFECVYIEVAPNVSVPNPGGLRPNVKDHALSVQLCARAMKAKTPLWISTASVDKDKVLHPNAVVKTGIVIPIFSFVLQQEFYTVFYSLQPVRSKSSATALLREISKAVVMAASTTLIESGSSDDEDDDVALNGPSLVARASSVAKEESGVGGEPQLDTLNNISIVLEKPELPHFITFSDLKDVMRVGEGGSSAIYTASFQGQTVCVKMLTEECERNPQCVADMRREVEIMASLRHPHICKYIASGQEPRMFVVMEWCGGGSLNKYLGFTEGSTSKRAWRRTPARPFVTSLRQTMQLAEALKYMHHEALPDLFMLHRDLKPDNIAFDNEGSIKLIDFGLAKTFPRHGQEARESAAYQMTGGTGSMRYMAPEVVLNKPYDERADVYSWAILAWEMCSGFKPFDDYGRHEYIKHVVRGNVRPIIDKRWPKEFAEILTEGWSGEASKRPSMEDVTSRLNALMAREEMKAQGWFNKSIRSLRSFQQQQPAAAAPPSGKGLCMALFDLCGTSSAAATTTTASAQ